MKYLLISLDLNSKENDFSCSTDMIEKIIESLFCDYVKPVANVYVVLNKNHYKCTFVRDKLKTVMHPNDNIFVAGLDGTYASWNYATINEKLVKVLNGRV